MLLAKVTVLRYSGDVIEISPSRGHFLIKRHFEGNANPLDYRLIPVRGCISAPLKARGSYRDIPPSHNTPNETRGYSLSRVVPHGDSPTCCRRPRTSHRRTNYTLHYGTTTTTATKKLRHRSKQHYRDRRVHRLHDARVLGLCATSPRPDLRGVERAALGDTKVTFFYYGESWESSPPNRTQHGILIIRQLNQFED